ncbi:hypothetical protein COLO4_10494 [Corchorus olitorius]|uniref:F-box domain-containing protein n=1 Tax=Corchorus olitorius TaxID=93759 RepID=A0A1R3K895_9ROSI|nr:hypothetical protein COLO4_10494 [Corchorus olitorius]
MAAARKLMKGEELNFDILYDIFSRLPAKSIARFSRMSSA